MLSEGEDTCQDELEISWKSSVDRSLCLYQSNKRLPLRCWENENSGSHRLAIEAASNVDFHLREMQDDMFVVSQEFEVVHDTTQYRRRRRNPWSFF